MANSTAITREIRFLIEDRLTHVYVLIDADGDCPAGIQGWHHKTFAAVESVQDVVARMVEDLAILWPLQAPPLR